MRKFLPIAIAAASLTLAMTMANVGPAAAQVAGARTATGVASPQSVVTDVQWRRGGWRGRGWRGRGWGGRNWWVPGAVIGGVVVGSAIAAGAYGPYGYPPGAYAPGAYPAEGDPVAYCMQRFRSYDPGSGTYLGFDGYRHACP
jgi:hypothetical protein